MIPLLAVARDTAMPRTGTGWSRQTRAAVLEAAAARARVCELLREALKCLLVDGLERGEGVRCELYGPAEARILCGLLIDGGFDVLSEAREREREASYASAGDGDSERAYVGCL